MFKRRKTVYERLLAIKHNQIISRQRFWREVKGYTEAIIIALIVTTFLFTKLVWLAPLWLQLLKAAQVKAGSSHY
jgi:hypothetical protein